jgi:uncharacterized repeat protein (TIGR01451 family)
VFEFDCAVSGEPRPRLRAIVGRALVTALFVGGSLGARPAMAAVGSDPAATALWPIAPNADLSIAKAAPPDVHEDGDLAYLIELRNPGPDPAAGVTLTDVIPSGTTFVSFSQISGPPFALLTPTVGGTGAVVATAATFPCTYASFKLVVHVTAPVGAVITNSATVTSATADPNPANNKASATTKVEAAADLSVTKSDSPDPVTAGENITYTIVAANAGPSDAQNVTVSDAIPANTTFVSFSQTSGPPFTLTTPPAGGTGAVTATAATFAAGASATFELVVNVSATTADGTVIRNTVTISSDTCDPDPANNSDTEKTHVKAPVEEPSADLSATKSDFPDPVAAGQNITYTIVVSSGGPSDAQSVTVSDAIPANTTFVSFTQTSGPAFTLTTPPAGGTGTVTATASTFAAGASATFELVVNVNAGTPNDTVITNTVTVSSSTGDPAPANNSATTTTQVSGGFET